METNGRRMQPLALPVPVGKVVSIIQWLLELGPNFQLLSECLCYLPTAGMAVVAAPFVLR